MAEDFKWTDELACEWGGFLESQMLYKPPTEIPSILAKWKQSKMPKKERIEVPKVVCTFRFKGYKHSKFNYAFATNAGVSEEKYPAIKAAIERVLNDEENNLVLQNIAETPRLIREAEEKAFNAARRVVHTGSATERQLETVVIESLKSMAAYADAQDYINSSKQNI